MNKNSIDKLFFEKNGYIQLSNIIKKNQVFDLLSEEIRITYPLIISITAISRLIILQKKDLDPSILIYESLAILIISLSIIVLRLRNLKDLNPKEVKNRKK